MSDNDKEYLDILRSNIDCPFVTKANCTTKIRASKLVMGVLFGVMSVFLALVVYAAGQSNYANAQYIDMTTTVTKHQAEVHVQVQDMQSSFDTYRAEKRASDKSVIEKLDEVKTELSEQRKEQRVLLEKILNLQIDVARKTGINTPNSG